jgi:hypothetical protein
MGALRTFFAQDDITFLSRAAGLEAPRGIGRALSENGAFGLEYRLFGVNPVGYHAVNLGVHLSSVLLVYVLALQLRSGRITAGAAALIFGVASLAFTPLHWASGIIELLTCVLLLAATVLWLESSRRGQFLRWIAAAVAFLAMFSKETAIAWLLPITVASPRSKRDLTPAVGATLLSVGVLLLTKETRTGGSAAAYAVDTSPIHIASNALTYVRWSLALNDPIRDVVAAVDGDAWNIALPVLCLVLSLIVATRHKLPPSVAVGLVWWLAFLLPVLPLAHHSYLYYLYIPWAGAALAVAAASSATLRKWPRPMAIAVGCLALGGYVLIEMRNIWLRERATRDAIPVDTTMRDSMLLSHALGGLLRAHLTPGSKVAFVNPVPGERFDVIRGAPTRAVDLARRTSYFPLEAVMREGETIRLFVPTARYMGFSDTIPEAWEDAECFYFEQRGWLEPWGSGPAALMHQAEVQIAARQWAAAGRTQSRLRALETGCRSRPQRLTRVPRLPPCRIGRRLRRHSPVRSQREWPLDGNRRGRLAFAPRGKHSPSSHSVGQHDVTPRREIPVLAIPE